jgi:hypothetical protein
LAAINSESLPGIIEQTVSGPALKAARAHFQSCSINERDDNRTNAPANPHTVNF